MAQWLIITLVILVIICMLARVDPRVIIIVVNATLASYFASASVSVSISRVESFVDTAVAPTQIDKVLSLIGVASAQNNSINNISNSIIQYAKADKYNEDLTTIAQGLTIYYSAFSYNSYPRNGKTWFNISNFFNRQNRVSCPDVTLDDTNAIFSESSANFSRENGFSFGSGTIIGPKAFQLGIAGNQSFSIFMTLNINAFDIHSDKQLMYELLRLPANTLNNNGLTIGFTPNIAEIGGMYGTNIMVSYGTQRAFASNTASGNQLIMINPAYTYLLVLVKDNLDISLYMYPNIDNVSTSSTNTMTLIKGWKIDPSEEVLFSNKECIVNKYRNIYGRIYNLGFYNRVLDDNMISSIFLHTQSELQKSNQVLSNLANQIAQLQDQLDQAKACPFDQPTCDACQNIADWTNTANIISSGDNDCHDAINTYCKANVRDPLCACWNPSNPLSQTPECKNFVSIFTKTLSEDTISNVRKTHCANDASANTSANTTQNQLLTSTTVMRKKDLLLNIDDNYNVNQTDMDAYNQFIIPNLYTLGEN